MLNMNRIRHMPPLRYPQFEVVRMDMTICICEVNQMHVANMFLKDEIEYMPPLQCPQFQVVRLELAVFVFKSAHFKELLLRAGIV